MSSAFQTGYTGGLSTYWLAYDATTGLLSTATILHSATGLKLAYTRTREASVSAVTGGSPAPVTLASATAAHADWGFLGVGGSLFRADFPAAAAAAGVPSTHFTITGVAGISFVQVDPTELMGSDPRAAALDSGTLAAALIAAGVGSGLITLPAVTRIDY